MKYKTEIYILIGTGLLVLLVFVITGFNIDVKIGRKNAETSSSNQYGPSPQAPVVDTMANHHTPRSADSNVFDSLMGKQAPDFTLESYDGKKYTLRRLKSKNVILFFNEGLMCYPSCWNQIAAFGSDSEFSKKNTVVFNITVDSKNDWKDAVNKMPELAKATVLFDSERIVSSAYGVLTLGSSMHRGQFPGHSYVI